MQQVLVKSLKDALDVFFDGYIGERNGLWVFRGVSSLSHELIPSVGRAVHTSKSFEYFEKSLLDSFKRQAFHYVDHVPENSFEWLALAQHHGLPTRLLDWSSNPLVALYFSCVSNEDADGRIFALRAETKLSDRGLVERDPLTIDKPMKIVPRNISERMFVQEGLFTIHKYPPKKLDDQLREDWKIQFFDVDGQSKRKIRYELYRIGIHHAKLFPSIDGLSEHVTWHHSVEPFK